MRLKILNEKIQNGMTNHTDQKQTEFYKATQELAKLATEKYERQMEEAKEYRNDQPDIYDLKTRNITLDYQTVLDMLIADANEFASKKNR